MANRDNPYEAAFEEYLRARGALRGGGRGAAKRVGRRKLAQESRLHRRFRRGPFTWLVDVKGRRFPSGDEQSRHYWKNWSTQDDLRSLAQWEWLFGDSFRGLFVFAYSILGDRAPLAGRRLVRAPRRAVRFRGRAAGGLRRAMPPDLASLGHCGHAHRRVSPPGSAGGGLSGAERSGGVWRARGIGGGRLPARQPGIIQVNQ